MEDDEALDKVLDEDPTLVGKGWEGDIDNFDTAKLRGLFDARTPSNAIIDKSELWPKGVVPYTISNSFSDEERNVIAEALKEYHTKTCIR